jgi:hypothetical protein
MRLVATNAMELFPIGGLGGIAFLGFTGRCDLDTAALFDDAIAVAEGVGLRL